jgi:hypothetical protein
MSDLTIEPGAQVREFPCPKCRSVLRRVTGFVYNNGDAYAVYYASCYHHDGHEVWIDVIFSDTWEEGINDHVSFGCRVGPVEGQTESAASLVQAGRAYSDSEMFGQRLTREQALHHPRLSSFWELVDHILVHDEVVAEHVYGPAHKTSHD